MFRNYLRTAWRTVWKNRRVCFINIAGLCIGMTTAIFILMWVHNEMSFDSYHPQADNIYRITNTLHLDKENTWVWQTSPLKLAEAAKLEIPQVKNVGTLLPFPFLIFNVNRHLFNEKEGAYVNKGWFEMFRYDFVQGNPESLFQNPFSILLTESEAKKYFGNRNAIGQIIKIDSINYEVQAIVKDNPANSSFQYKALIPLTAYLSDPRRKKDAESWASFNFMTFLLLSSQHNVVSVTKQLNNILDKNKQGNNATASLEPIKKIHFESDLQFSMLHHGNKEMTYIFIVLGFLLILIACINYVNLTTARASLRAKEIGIRKTVGARRRQLFTQFLAESLVISFISLVITILLINIFLPLFNQLTTEQFSFSMTSIGIWKLLLGTLLFVTILNSIYPALLLSSYKPLNVFRGINILQVKDVNFRKALVILQFTVSALLIIGTIVIFNQLKFIQASNPGYNEAQIFSMQIPFYLFKNNQAEKPATMEAFKQKLLHQTSIAGVSLTSESVINGQTATSGNSTRWEGKDSTFNPTVSELAADAGFPEMFHVQLKLGRWFYPGNKNDKRNIILNETAVNEFHLHKPVIGQQFIFQGDTGQVIGIAKDFHYLSLHDKIGPLVIFNNPHWFSYIYVETSPGKITQALRAANNIWEEYFPDTPFDYTFMNEAFDNLYKSDRLASKLVLIFSLLAIFISCLGLLGLTAFAAERRTKEIGIRKILGASLKDIVSLLSKDFMVLVLIAFIIAAPIAWWIMNKWLQNFAYRIHIGSWIFILAGIILFAIALLTTGYYAMRTGMRNPVKNLRTE